MKKLTFAVLIVLAASLAIAQTATTIIGTAKTLDGTLIHSRSSRDATADLSANQVKLGPVSAVGPIGGIYFAGPGATPSIDTEITACGSVNPCQIWVSPDYTGVFPPVNAVTSNIIIMDFHSPGPSPAPFGTNTITYGGQTTGVVSFERHSWAPRPVSSMQSSEMVTDVASFTGALPSGQTIETHTSVATTIGNISGTMTNLSLVGGEWGAETQSNGGTIPLGYGSVEWCKAVSGTTNITTCAGGISKTVTNTGAGTITNAIGHIFEPQNAGTSRNADYWSEGTASLYANQNGYNWNIVDSTNRVQPLFQVDASNNVNLRTVGGYMRLLDKNNVEAWHWLSPNFQFDPDGLGLFISFGIGGSRILTASGTFQPTTLSDINGNIAGTGFIRMQNTDKIAWRNSGNTADDVIGEIQTKRGVAGCATAAAAGATCTVTVTWPSAFADAHYTVTGCTGNGIISGKPILQGITAKAAASVTVQTMALDANAAQFSSIECGAIHD